MHHISACTPPAKNDAAPAVVAPVASGQGACSIRKLINLDETAARVVRVGSLVEWTFKGDVLCARVERVRAGKFWCWGASEPCYMPCCAVRVIGGRA